MRKSFAGSFVLLFFFVFIDSSKFFSPHSFRVGKGGRELVSLCYGVVYGNAISMKSLQFFIDYYHKLGVERIVAFLHPSLFQSLPLFQEMGLSITMWNSNYTFDRSSHDQNHKRALEQCISSEINHFGATTIIVCDPDEFLYFDPEKYDSLHSFLKEFRDMKDVGQLFLSRWYYEIDLCLKQQKNENVTIWETPYIGEKKIDTFGKSIFFTNKFLGFYNKLFEHHFDVMGKTINVNHSKAHFKHFRRFLNWDGDCHVVSKGDEKQIQYQEKRDVIDPAQKKIFYASSYLFERDDNLFIWRDFVENLSLPEKQFVRLGEKREGGKGKWRGERDQWKGEKRRRRI